MRDQVKVLDRIQKGLTSFLEFKQSLFPRMSFLSNEELLEVLTSCQTPKYIQPHIIKV